MELNHTAGNGSMQSDSAGPQQHTDYVGFVSAPLLLLFGVCGNLLTVVVMRSRPFSRFASSYVLICLAVSDTVVTLLLPFNKAWVHELLGTDIRSYSEHSCQGFYWAFRTAKMTSSWMVVLVCMERFVAVCLPRRAPSICRKRYAVLSICLVYGIIGVYNGVWVTFADHIVNGVCRPNTQPPGLVQINRTFLVVGLTIYSFLPCLILTVITILIIVKLYEYRNLRRKTRVLRGAPPAKDPTSKTTVMLLCIIIAFVVLVLPITFAHLIFFIKRKPIFASQDKGVVIFREIATLFEHTNYSINFLLYIVASPCFRNHLPKIFRCRTDKQHGSSEDNLVNSKNSGLDKGHQAFSIQNGGFEVGVEVHQVPNE